MKGPAKSHCLTIVDFNKPLLTVPCGLSTFAPLATHNDFASLLFAFFDRAGAGSGLTVFLRFFFRSLASARDSWSADSAVT